MSLILHSWLLAVIVQVLFHSGSSASCLNLSYEVQPIFEIPCNPYPSDTLALKCSVRGPASTSSDSKISIKWFRILQSSDEKQNLSDAAGINLVEIDILGTDAVTYQSVLTLTDLTANDVAGLYWCQVALNDTDDILSDVGPVTVLRTPVSYSSLEECQYNFIFTSKGSDVSFDGHSCQDTTISTSPDTITGGNPDSAIILGEYGISLKMMIIVAVVGGVLLVVINVLLVIVCCLCLQRKSRVQKMKKREFTVQQCISTVSLMSQQPPASPPQLSNNMMTEPPKKPPPISPKTRPTVPLRSTLPPHLTCQLSAPETDECSDGEEYTLVHVRHQGRAATISGGCNSAFASTTPSKKSIRMFQIPDSNYKSLNRETMDDHPVYADPGNSRSNSIDYEDSDSEGTEEVSGSSMRSLTSVHPAFPKKLMQSVAMTRESIDGEYVMPNEAFHNSNMSVQLSPIVSPTNSEQPIYMDITSY